MYFLPDIIADLGNNKMLLPYLQRQFPAAEGQDLPSPKAALKFRSAADTPASSDEEFESYCAEHSLPIATLACCDIIGTGMRGLPRRIAEGISRGTFVHILGNEARISLVHATDVAKAASIVAGCEGTYTLTDGCEHTIHDLAEAIAYRFNDKRLYTIKPRWARWWYGREYFQTLTTDHLLDCTMAIDFPDFKPVDTIHYMHTHVYDSQSL